MIGNLSRRERLLIALAVLAMVVVIGWEFVVQPIREKDELTAELVPARERLLARHHELIARKADLIHELEAVTARIDTLSAKLLTAAAPPVAASELQKIAKEMATAAGTEVRSERILPPVERGEVLEIPVEIAVSGEIKNLVDLLARLEGAPKLVTVQDLKVRVMNIAHPKDLLATITVSGFILPARART
ncbi:MAG: type 4a pilus biogenesis protein PilO [Candidatus Rokubacteria bacterium]|nr:type 4a pilus biogenesis protein PilO [Candidatus Rokubacteria bacterium]